MDDAVQDSRGRADTERQTPGCGEHDGARPCENVGARPDILGRGLLGSHETRTADQQTAVSDRRTVGSPGDPEIQHTGTVRGEDDIRRLEIPMDHTGVMNRRERLGQSGGERPQGAIGQRPIVGDVLLQSRSGNIHTGNPGLVGVRIGVQHPARPEATYPASQLNLSAKSCSKGWIIRQFRTNDLQRGPVPVPLREKNDAHPPATKPVQDSPSAIAGCRDPHTYHRASPRVR